MKKLLAFSFILVLLCTVNSYADHFVGYDLCLINIKNPDGTPTNNYKFRLRIFRDVTGIPIPVSQNFVIKRSNNHVTVDNFTCTKINPQTFLTYPPEDCPPAQAQLRVELGIYESPVINMSAYNNVSGYYVMGSSCCRNIGIINVEGNSSSYGIIFTMEFPRLNTGTPTQFNSSPEFKVNPLTFFCVGKPYTLNWKCQDPDGDSLVYYLAKPLGNDADGQKPFDTIPYAAGYNINYNIIDGVPDLTINPKTGIINFIPTRAGKYLVAFRVEEWRKILGVPTKIGEIRREYQLETVLCPEAPPVTEDNNNQKKVIVDTINLGEDFEITFTSRDTPTDSLYMYLLPNIKNGENLLDPNSFEGKWGEPGFLVGGTTAQNLIIDGIGVIQGQFKWTPKCNQVREKPYNFTVVVRDKTCPSPFYDSTFVTLYLKKKENISPIFTNKYLGKIDTITKSTPLNKKTKKYYIRAGETIQLASDSVILTYDKDSSQSVVIKMIADPANGPDINGRLTFSAITGLVHSNAIFRFTSTCEDKLEEPVRVKFIAYDNDCLKPDTIDFSIEIYIKDQPNLKPLYSVLNPDTVRANEGQQVKFVVSLYDTTSNININKYKNITLFPDLTDFANATVQGGSMIYYNALTGQDSLHVEFTWTPNCANVRTEPYKLYLRANDEGCPTIKAYDTILVYALGPYNSAPLFKDSSNSTISVIDTVIYGGDLFKYKIFATDTNQRFDSVYISLDPNSEIANPAQVANVGYVVPAQGKDSALTELVWQTACSDVRGTKYIAYVKARDNECVNPEVNELVFNIEVRERPNATPYFTNLGPSSISYIDVYAGETFVLDINSLDTTKGEFITVDTVSTNIPFNLSKPSISRSFGLGEDTVKTQLSWTIDCSLIRDEPYKINIASWDGACRNPQDSAKHTLIINVLRNPELQPSFNAGKDTIIELVAGEEFKLELNSSSIMANDSLLISTYGEVYSGIPGNLATFENVSVGKANFVWSTSCDQIRDSTYTVYFTTNNNFCKTNEESFRIKFKIIPNTDVINAIPNVFTPNADGINDKYSIINQYKVYCDPGFKFTIFNRWGKIVFESVEPNFEWSAEGLGSGTYFYTLESRARSQSGTIDIIK